MPVITEPKVRQLTKGDQRAYVLHLVAIQVQQTERVQSPERRHVRNQVVVEVELSEHRQLKALAFFPPPHSEASSTDIFPLQA